jgi:hypothetical protein
VAVATLPKGSDQEIEVPLDAVDTLLTAFLGLLDIYQKAHALVQKSANRGYLAVVLLKTLPGRHKSLCQSGA